MNRTKSEASLEKRSFLNACEKDGLIADSMDVRQTLIDRMNTGEITHAQLLEELKKIKRLAKKKGQLTRAQAYSRG